MSIDVARGSLTRATGGINYEPAQNHSGRL
jgi:hypothetical protein